MTPGAGRIRGKDEMDWTVDPPPDLVIEIDITRPLLDKLPIYAAVGVPEVWPYQAQELMVCVRQEGAYVVHDESLALPGGTPAILWRFLDQGKQRSAWLRNVRDWVRRRGADE